MPQPVIWVDADACPGPVRDIVIRAAIKNQIRAVFVANKPLTLGASPLVEKVLVSQGPDVVDQYIVEHVNVGDLVITQDIPLASDIVAKGLIALSPRGVRFSPQNMGERLSMRNLMEGLRDNGMVTGGPDPFGEKEKRAFANAFDKELTVLLKGN